MSIFNHFEQINLSQDQEEALTKLETFLTGSDHLFMLKGYAGTGKTTLIKGLTQYLSSTDQLFQVLAPTGRAAKILREKTGYGKTIHRGIYNFNVLETKNNNAEDDAELSFEYIFPINVLSEKTIIIVDEASMVQAKFHKNELFTFGTNIMLDDLLTFAALKSTGSKLIFVGDPAQLSPVGESESIALKQEFFNSLGYSCIATTLTKINRQEDNLILQNSMKIREVLDSNNRFELKLEYDNHSFIKISPEEIFERYTDLFPSPKVGDGVVINYSNSQCYHNNIAIREKLFPGHKIITPGDIIIIGNNNYQTFGVEIFNGDMAEVIGVGETYKPEPVPVYCEIAGQRIKIWVKYVFRDLVVRFPWYNQDVHITVLESLLDSPERDLSICEIKGLYIEFKIRFDKEQKARREKGLGVYKVGSEEFKNMLRNDKYYNALRAKYGYSITCHKAQGGEWDNVFVDYTGCVSLKDEPLRWCYTATTRGINKLFALNAPNFGKNDKFKISGLTVVGKITANSLSLLNVATSPFHNENDHKAKSLKYWEISEKFIGTKYRIKDVASLGPYHERYTITDGENDMLMDGFHKESGHYIKPFIIISSLAAEEKSMLEKIVNTPIKNIFTIDYSPKAESLIELYSLMQSLCYELDISITNIVEEEYKVIYSLITDNPYAVILFSFDKNFKLTTAMPRTLGSPNDSKLIQLTQKLLDYVI